MDYRKAIDEAILYCTTLPNFRSGLFIYTEAESDVVYELIDDRYKNNFEIKPLSIGTGWVLTFDNDSVIYIIHYSNDANNLIHAPRLHMVYISGNIRQEVFAVLIRPMITPYQIRDSIRVIGIGE